MSLKFNNCLLLLFAFIISGLVSCRHEPVQPIANNNGGNNGGGNTGGGNTGGGTGNPQPCDPNVVYFQNQILPILQANCVRSGCHNASSAQDGIILESYQSVMNSDIVRPGDAEDSDIIEVLTETDPDKIMPRPPAAPLTSQQIGLIRDWINQGAQNLQCSNTTCDTSNVTFSGAILPLMQNNCQGCHSGAGATAGVNLTTYAGVRQVALDGRLLGTVEHRAGFTPMPYGGLKLPDCNISKIRIWVQNGAQNN